MAMTTPVLTRPPPKGSDEGAMGEMSFVLPSKFWDDNGRGYGRRRSNLVLLLPP